MELGVLASSIFLQFLSFDELFYQWESIGVFRVLLPFLLIFAVIFGVLTATKIFGDNRGVAAIISIVVGLIAIRDPNVSVFITQMVVGLGFGLTLVLIVLILSTLFLHKNTEGFYNTMLFGGLIVAVIIAISVLNNLAWFGSYWWQENWKTIVWIIVIAAVAVPAFRDPKRKKKEGNDVQGPFFIKGGKGDDK